MRAVQGGARRPKEIREATGLKVNTEQRRRKTLYERKLLANTDEGITITAEGEKALAKDTGWAEYGKATR